MLTEIMAIPIKESKYAVVRKTDDCICMFCGGYGTGIEFENKPGEITIEVCDNCLRDIARTHLGSSIHKTKFTKEEFMTAYREGKSDSDIGRLLGVNALTVKRYRELYRLPPKGGRFRLPYPEKKKIILELIQQKVALTRNDLPKGFRGAFTKLLFDPDVDIVTFRFVRGGRGRTHSAYQLFQDDIVGKTVYFLNGDDRIVDFLASKLRKPVTQSNAKTITRNLRDHGFTLEEAHTVLMKAGYEYI